MALDPALIKKYGLIAADPAWQYSNAGTRGAAENHYSTMTLAELCALPVSKIAADDSVLLLWSTWPMMPEALRVITAWGFNFVTGFPWIKITDVPRQTLWGETYMKPQFGVGFWVRGCSEYVLIAKRGNPKPPERDFVGLISENFGHSRKPENLYEYAEALPGPYLEMFARRARDGWDVWGNEASGSITLEPEPRPVGFPCCESMKTALEERAIFYDPDIGDVRPDHHKLMFSERGEWHDVWFMKFCPFCGKAIPDLRFDDPRNPQVDIKPPQVQPESGD